MAKRAIFFIFIASLGIFCSGCGSVTTYGTEYNQLSELQRYFVGPWHQHGDIDFSKPYSEIKFDYENWDELLTLCRANTAKWENSHKRKYYGDRGLLGDRPVRPMGCYIEKLEGFNTPVIVWIKGREDVFLHELAHHYGVIDEDS